MTKKKPTNKANFKILWNDKQEAAYYIGSDGFAVPVISGEPWAPGALKLDFALIERVVRIPKEER